MMIKRTLSWIAWSLLVTSARSQGCGHPPVPPAASYVNVTGGLGQETWVVRYICDTGENTGCYLFICSSVIILTSLIYRKNKITMAQDIEKNINTLMENIKSMCTQWNPQY